MWPALAILAASAFVQHQNNREALKRQDNLRKAMEAYQRGKSRQALAATEQLLEKQTPQAREQELQQVTADRAQSLRDTVGAAQAFDARPSAGSTSPEYTKAQERAAESVAARTKRAIEQLSVMGAPGEQARKHALRFGRAAGTVDAANLASENVGRAYRTDIAGVRPDPFLDLASKIGMAVGGGMLSLPAAPAAAAGGSGISATAAGEGLKIGAGQGPNLGAGAPPGFKTPAGFQIGPRFGPQIRTAYSLFGQGG